MLLALLIAAAMGVAPVPSAAPVPPSQGRARTCSIRDFDGTWVFYTQAFFALEGADVNTAQYMPTTSAGRLTLNNGAATLDISVHRGAAHVRVQLPDGALALGDSDCQASIQWPGGQVDRVFKSNPSAKSIVFVVAYPPTSVAEQAWIVTADAFPADTGCRMPGAYTYQAVGFQRNPGKQWYPVSSAGREVRERTNSTSGSATDYDTGNYGGVAASDGIFPGTYELVDANACYMELTFGVDKYALYGADQGWAWVLIDTIGNDDPEDAYSIHNRHIAGWDLRV